MPRKWILTKSFLYLFPVFLFLAPVFLQAQTAAELDAVLGAKAVTYAQAARFVLASADDNTPGAFDLAMSRGWLPKNVSAADAINMGELSFLMMKAFNLKGGLMYRMIPGPHYAYRSMVSCSVIQGSADPAMKVSGERFLIILGKVLNLTGR